MRSHFKYYRLFAVILIFIFSSCISIQAQYYFRIFAPNADTLYSKLNEAGDKQKMQICNQLAFYHSFNSPDSAIYYADEALRLEEEYPNPIEKATAYRHLGNAHVLKSEYGQTLFYLNQALQIFEQNKAYRKIAEVYFDLGKVNYDLDDYNRALLFGTHFIKLFNEKNNDDLIIATILEYSMLIGSMAVTAREKGDYELAKKYFYEYYKLSQEHNLPYRIKVSFISSMASSFGKNHEWDSALKYTYLARSLYPKNKGKTQEEQSGSEMEIGLYILNKGDVHGAIPYLKKSLNNYSTDGVYGYASKSAAYLCKAYLTLGDIDSALYYYNTSLQFVKKMHKQNFGSPSNTEKPIIYSGYQLYFTPNELVTREIYYTKVVSLYKEIYRLYLHIGDSSKALVYLQYLLPNKDSLNMVKKDIEMNKVQSRYETERLEKQLILLSEENELTAFRLQRNSLVFWFIVITLMLVIAIGIFYFRQNRINSMHEKLLVEQKLFRSQMNPHFVFNALASVQNFIVKQDDTKASIYLARFSDLVRSILNNSMEEQVTLEEEINTIENYLELQKVRFPDKFDYAIEVDEKLDPESLSLPPMLAQPFIENAIEHGIKYKATKGNIKICFHLKDRMIEYAIEDDGIGRQKAQENLLKRDKDHQSLATIITRERIKVLNKKFRQKISLEIIDLKDEKQEAKGTLVRFTIPIR